MHKLNVAHGNLKIVCPSLHSSVRRALTFVQTNILVDVHGHARLAGLGVAFPLARMPGVDIDRLFRGIAPELAVPQRYGLTDTGTTKESDVYAFGVLAWEVSPPLKCLMDELLNRVRVFLRFSLSELHFPMRVGLREFTRC